MRYESRSERDILSLTNRTLKACDVWSSSTPSHVRLLAQSHPSKQTKTSPTHSNYLQAISQADTSIHRTKHRGKAVRQRVAQTSLAASSKTAKTAARYTPKQRQRAPLTSLRALGSPDRLPPVAPQRRNPSRQRAERPRRARVRSDGSAVAPDNITQSTTQYTEVIHDDGLVRHIATEDITNSAPKLHFGRRACIWHEQEQALRNTLT